jgi:ligand-binding sensor domain-containing protein
MSGYQAALRDWLSASHWLPALLCCLPLWLSAAPAENPAHDPLLIALTTEQGLSGGGINQLHVDHSGFLWLATDSGLNRFDASQVRRVNLTGDPQTELSITKLLEDSRQQLFVAAENQGLFQLDRETAQAVQLLALQQLETDSLPRLHDVIEQQPDQLLLAVNKAVYRLTLPGRQLEKIFEFDGGNCFAACHCG